jgi:hypothetical protein
MMYFHLSATMAMEVILGPVGEVILDPVGEVILDPAAVAILDPVGEVILDPVGEVILDPAAEVILDPVGEVTYYFFVQVKSDRMHILFTQGLLLLLFQKSKQVFFLHVVIISF